MGGFPSHDAPGFLFTTAVQHNKSGGTTELCLVPLLRRYFNDNNKRLKDAVIENYLKGPPNSTQMAAQILSTNSQLNANSNNTNTSSGVSSGAGTPPASPLSTTATSQNAINMTEAGYNNFRSYDIAHGNGNTDEAQNKMRAVNAYKKLEHLLGEIESSFFTSTRVIYQSLDTVKEKAMAIQEVRDTRKRAEDEEFFGVASTQYSKMADTSVDYRTSQDSTNLSSAKVNALEKAKGSTTVLKTSNLWSAPEEPKAIDFFGDPRKIASDVNFNPLSNFSGTGKTLGISPAQFDASQTPVMRPVPCAICIIEPEGGGRGKMFGNSDISGAQNAPNAAGAFPQSSNGVKNIEWINLQGRRLHCIGYLSCFGLECADVVSHQLQGPNASNNTTVAGGAMGARKQTKIKTPSPIAPPPIQSAQATSPIASGALSYKIPRLGSCSDKGCDVFLDISLENDEEFRFLLEPIVFLASMTFRSQFMTCSMWQKPVSSKDVEEAYYNYLQLLNVHVMLSPERYQHLKAFYDQFPLIEFIEKLGFSDRPSGTSTSSKSPHTRQLMGVLKDGGAGAVFVEETVDTCESSRNSLNMDLCEGMEADGKTTAESNAGGVLGGGCSSTSALRRTRRGRKRGAKKSRTTREQDDIYRQTTSHMPKFTFYELHTGQYGVEVVFEGGVLARFMKYVTETAAFETVKGNYVRCDLGPLMKERRHLLQSYREALQEYLDQNEEDERLFGNEQISAAIHTWLRHGASMEELRKQTLQNAQAAALPIGGANNLHGVNPATLMQAGMLPPMFSGQLGGAGIPVLQNSGAGSMPLMYSPGMGYVAPTPGMCMQQPPPPHAQNVFSPLNIQFQLVMPNSTGQAFACGAPSQLGIMYPHQAPPFHFIDQAPPPPPPHHHHQHAPPQQQQQHHMMFPPNAAPYGGVSYQYVMGANGQLMAIPVATAPGPTDIMLYNQYNAQQSFPNMLAVQQQLQQQQQQQQFQQQHHQQQQQQLFQQHQHHHQQQQQQPQLQPQPQQQLQPPHLPPPPHQQKHFVSVTIGMNSNDGGALPEGSSAGNSAASPFTVPFTVPATSQSQSHSLNLSGGGGGGPPSQSAPAPPPSEASAMTTKPSTAGPNTASLPSQPATMGSQTSPQGPVAASGKAPIAQPSDLSPAAAAAFNANESNSVLLQPTVKAPEEGEQKADQDLIAKCVGTRFVGSDSISSAQWFLPHGNHSEDYNPSLFHYGDSDNYDTELALAAATATITGLHPNSCKVSHTQKGDDDDDDDIIMCDPSRFFFGDN